MDPYLRDGDDEKVYIASVVLAPCLASMSFNVLRGDLHLPTSRSATGNVDANGDLGLYLISQHYGHGAKGDQECKSPQEGLKEGQGMAGLLEQANISY